MTGIDFTLAGAALTALPSGALFWAAERMLVVSDLHLGKSDRLARRGGGLLPPYEVTDTLTRLEADLDRTHASRVICLGDSFDDDTAMRDLAEGPRLWLARLIAGRDWTWIEGNHDPGPVDLPGSHRAQITRPPLTFRHIARADAPMGEVSGHYHPKRRLCLRGRALTRACFLFDDRRLILPAFGTYTGGLRSDAPVLDALMGPGARAILTGAVPCMVPMRG